MNKADLIAAIADDAEISKAKAEYALNSAIEHIIKAVTKGDSVQLIGFGTFASGKRAARMGRNPQTGAAIKIKAKKVARFKAGKELSSKV
ncbi:MAG: HU family DNA-binding protein [Burkholderiaceae bacterium]|nr:HU family DNA-binding protein [Burkholderiaceae bacterium]